MKYLSICKFFQFVLQECYLENDSTSLFYVANSLMTLQTLYGTIPKIYAKGDMSKVRAILIY